MQLSPLFRIALANDIPEICQTENVHSLKINADEKSSLRSTGDYKVRQFILILDNFNVKVEGVN